MIGAPIRPAAGTGRGRLAQSVRARGSHPRGHWFESSIAHHKSHPRGPAPGPRFDSRERQGTTVSGTGSERTYDDLGRRVVVHGQLEDGDADLVLARWQRIPQGRVARRRAAHDLQVDDVARGEPRAESDRIQAAREEPCRLVRAGQIDDGSLCRSRLEVERLVADIPDRDRAAEVETGTNRADVSVVMATSGRSSTMSASGGQTYPPALGSG